VAQPATQANVRRCARAARSSSARERRSPRGSAARAGSPIDAIARAITQAVAAHQPEGVRVLVGAGRTEEPIDPVRVLTNRSSGRMGFALAKPRASAAAR
jgi:phosphopantothenoylcysteine synthetase/decarboxylase